MEWIVYFHWDPEMWRLLFIHIHAGPELSWTLVTSQFARDLAYDPVSLAAALGSLAVDVAFLWVVFAPIERRIGVGTPLAVFLIGGSAGALAEDVLRAQDSVGPSSGILALAGFAIAAWPQIFGADLNRAARLARFALPPALALWLAMAAATSTSRDVADVGHLFGFLSGVVLSIPFLLRAARSSTMAGEPSWTGRTDTG